MQSIDKTVIHPGYVSGEEKLEVFALPVTNGAPYGYFVQGTYYGKEFSIALTRSGAKDLALALLKSL
jgi:hypothetical protein